MTELNDTEVAEVAGGVVAGPNGEGCTDPRGTGKGELVVQLSSAE